jgi:hypothetical protein
MMLAGCGREEPLIETSGNTDSDTFDVKGLQTLLDRRAKAQLEGDEEGYLADLDASNSDLIKRERLEFTNLQQFDVEDIRYATGQVGNVGFELPPPPGQEPTGPYDFLPVTKVVKLSADAGPDGVLGPGESFEYVVDRRDGAWVVTNIVPMNFARLEKLAEEDPTLKDVLPANAPWRMDALQVVNRGKIWLAADDTVTDLESYADAAADQVEDVEQLWGDRPKFPGHVLFLTRNKKALARWYGVGHGQKVSDVRPGYGVPLVGVRGNGQSYAGQFVGARNLVYLPATEELWNDPVSIMRHELTHTTTMRAFGTGDNPFLASPPTWAVEGFATFIEIRGNASAEPRIRTAAVNGFAGSLPDSDTFQTGDALTVTTNYALGYTVFRFVEQIRDLETAVNFYREVIKWDDGLRFGVYTPFIEKPAFDGVCQQTLGLRGPEFLDQWAAFVQAGA